MAPDQAVAAAQAPGRAAGGRPARVERHSVGASHGGAVACSAGALRALDDLLHPVHPLAQAGHPGSVDGCGGGGLRRQGAEERPYERPGSPAGGGSKKGGLDRGLGRSRGGRTTKSHAGADGTGLPIRYDLGPGQAPDTTAAGALLAPLPPDRFLVADTASDAEWIRDRIEHRDAVPLLPAREGANSRRDRSPCGRTAPPRPQRCETQARLLQPLVSSAKPDRPRLPHVPAVPSHRPPLRKARCPLPRPDQDRYWQALATRL